MKKTDPLIILGESGDPRKQANKAPYFSDTAQVPSEELSVRGQPKAYISRVGKAAKGFRKSGSTNVSLSTGMQSGSSIQAAAQAPLYYDYRWSTPDKYYFPRNRIVANSIWREIYKRDAVVATGTDMYSELPWSDFSLTGIDDSEVRHIYEDMFSELDLVPKFADFTRDFLIAGEAFLHTLFDDDKGIWKRVESFNPDFIRVKGVGLVSEQPLLWMLPTPELKRLINDPDPRIRKLQKLLPKEVISAVRMNKEIPLDPLNTTFLAKFRNARDLRGTSMYTRIYRVIMYEDFIVNASLAIAQRHAAPMRLFKMGDPTTGWMPTDEDIAGFMEQLSMAESDPLGAIVTHANVSCDLIGVADRVLLISKEWDFIERLKLLALGIPKGVVLGESSFASSSTGLQVLLDRLAHLRTKFEREWILKKVCLPIAKMHKFYKRPRSELDHNIRVKHLDDLTPLVPTIKWKKILESSQEIALLNVWRDLKERGIISDRTYANGSGVDMEVERRNQIEELEYKKAFNEKFGIVQQPPAGAGGGGGMGGGMPPPSPTEEMPPAEEVMPPPAVPEAQPEPLTPPGSVEAIKEVSSSLEENIDKVSLIKDKVSKHVIDKTEKRFIEDDFDDVIEELENRKKKLNKILRKDDSNDDFWGG